MRHTLSEAVAWLIGQALILFVKVWTGLHPLWVGSQPSPRARVYYANHGSHGDLVLIWACLPPTLRYRTRAVAGQDYWRASALRQFIAARVFRALLIDRHPPADAPSPVEQMTRALQAGDSLILFPEGTRNTTDAALLPFRSGLYHLSQAQPQVEFIPVWLHNIRRMMPKGESVPVPVICTAHFGAPLALRAHEDKDEFLARAQAALLALRPRSTALPAAA